MPFKLIPALRKCDLVPLRPGRVLDRTFAHREQECPSANGSVSREVNKARKTGCLILARTRRCTLVGFRPEYILVGWVVVEVRLVYPLFVLHWQADFEVSDT
jgi:hypothetical protein